MSDYRVFSTYRQLADAMIRRTQDGRDLADGLWLLVYHCTDSDDQPAETRPLFAGYPPTPWVCPLCGVVVEDRIRLMYNIAEEVQP